MAKEKLLLLMIFIFLKATGAFAESSRSAEDIIMSYKESSNSLPEQDIIDFKRIHKEKLRSLSAKNSSNAALLIFISSSMSKNNIAELIESAKYYNATLVMKGFIEGSFKKTTEFLTQFFQEGESDIGVIIDPTLFAEFEVKMVPTFVLAKDISFDKIAGNQPLKSVLEIFKDQGELKVEAESFLKGRP
jgi:conjugal transfer pilus assembly protein TrbC